MLAGYVYNGTVTNCFAIGTITAKENVGGLIGYTYSDAYNNYLPTTVENCYSRVTITGLKTGVSNYLGGLIGKDYVYDCNPTVIKRCYSASLI